MTLERTSATPASDRATDAERLFADHYMPVMRMCMHHLRDESDAEDAVQEVFRRAVQRRAELRGDPLPWLITVARNVCRDEVRRRRSVLRAAEQAVAAAAAETATSAGSEDNPERVVVGNLFVRELLGHLTPAERRVVAARVYQRASGADAAHSLGVSSSTTRVLLARARHKLRQYLEETRAAFAGIPVLGTRFFHSMRRHLLLRPHAAEAGAGLLLPAALMVTVMFGPSGGLPAVAAGTPSVALVGGAGSVHDAHVAGQASAPGTATLIHVVPAASASHAAQSGSGNDSGPLSLPPLKPEVDRVMVSDIEPSPNYTSDHTVLMLGATGGCSPPPCTQLFESTDGGATWSYLGAPGLSGATLILPPSSFAQGTFYTWGAVGLQMTTDGGRTFVTVVPPVGGFAEAAPAWSGLGVLLSNESLWQLAGVTPRPVSLFGTNQQSAGAPLVLPATGGRFEVLQPVTAAVSLGRQELVLHCTQVCDQGVALPFYSLTTALVPSPNNAVDHTVFAVGFGHWLAVSHDDGASFGPAIALPVDQIIAVAKPGGGRRLVAGLGTFSAVLKTSDDDGVTWQTAALDPTLNLADNAIKVSVVSAGRLIASLMRADRSAYAGFACSSDGTVWTSCSRDADR